jgi:ribosomal 30S subunit maturation factor RimM
VLIPFIKKIVEKIDVKSKVIKIKKIEGLQI